MKPLGLLLAAATVFGLLPITQRLPTVVAAVALVGLGVLLALAASATPSAIAVAAGALGAFGSGVLGSTAPALAGAVLVGLCFAERSVRVRERNARIVHVGLALAGGALAGYVSARYAVAEPLVRAVVVVIAAVLSAAPLLVPADDPIAFALDDLSRDMDEPAQSALREGASLRRSVDESLLDESSARDARSAWKNLLRLARARARLMRTAETRPELAKLPAGAVGRRVDERIRAHVDGLTRMYTAADAANAAALSLDDGALTNVDAAGSSMDEVSKAIMNEVA